MNASIVGKRGWRRPAGTHSFSFSNGVRDGVAESQLFLLYCARRAGWKSILGRSSVEAEDLKIDSFSIIHAELSLESLRYPGVCFLQCEAQPYLCPLMSHDGVCVWSRLALISPQCCLIPGHLACWANPPPFTESPVCPDSPALLGWITFKTYSSHTLHPPPPDGLIMWNSGFSQFLPSGVSFLFQ